jgi:hypothetical protein
MAAQTGSSAPGNIAVGYFCRGRECLSRHQFAAERRPGGPRFCFFCEAKQSRFGFSILAHEGPGSSTLLIVFGACGCCR